MANVITLPGGRNETIFDEQDFLNLVDGCMGFEARRWLEDWLAERDGDSDYIDGIEKESDGLRTHLKEVMAELRRESETIAQLIREKEIDRRALSAAAGIIGRITMKHASIPWAASAAHRK